MYDSVSTRAQERRYEPVLGHTMHRAVPETSTDARGACGDESVSRIRAPVSPSLRYFWLSYTMIHLIGRF